MAKTLLFGVVPGPDIPSAEHLLKEGKSHIDGIELRLDHFKSIDLNGLKQFLQSCGLPVMFTLRRNDQGGVFLGTEEERLKWLETLCTLEPAYLDLEYDVPEDFRKKLFLAYPKIQFISSHHDFQQTPADLEAVYTKIKTPYAHIYKFAAAAHSILDELRMLQLIQNHSEKEKIIGVSLGTEGRETRLLAPVVGCYLTYATVAPDTATAPGQLAAREMQEIYRFSELNRETKIYAVIGDPIDKSLGHVIHNAIFTQAHLNAVYVRLHVKPEEIPPFFEQIPSLPFKGISVTMPHKEAVLPFLTEMSIQVRVIGACNTIQIDSGHRIGYNTDGIGALNAIERREQVFGKHVIFIGAGGTAKALVFEAAQRGASVSIINRTPEKAVELAATCGGRGGGFDLMQQLCTIGYDVLVNCTPDSDVVDEKWILPEKIIMDIVYVPKTTPFLAKAVQKKCRIVYGYEMFVGQALEQLKIWFPEGIQWEQAYTLIEEKVTSTLVE